MKERSDTGVSSGARVKTPDSLHLLLVRRVSLAQHEKIARERRVRRLFSHCWRNSQQQEAEEPSKQRQVERENVLGRVHAPIVSFLLSDRMEECHSPLCGVVARAAEPGDYPPQTTLSGVIEKRTGEEPFDVSVDILETAKNRKSGPWRDQKLDDVPVNFLSDADTTGGNSGSPSASGARSTALRPIWLLVASCRVRGRCSVGDSLGDGTPKPCVLDGDYRSVGSV